VQVAGETVVALPEDSADILAFDRRNGTRLWTRRKPEGVDYVVGRRGAALIVAGGRTAACVDLADGRERWRKPIAGSTGRGTLCGQEALIPCGQTILRLRAEDGMTLGSMWAQRMDDLPLGNLYVNGDQLLVAGPERLYALVDAREALARMAERLARQPTAEAYAERGHLYMGVQRYVDAVADLREAWRLRRGSAGEEAARGPLMTTLWRAAEQDSGAAKALHDEACAVAVTASERAESIWRLAQYRERNGDTNGALVLYAAIVADSDAMISPALSNANWEISARRLAAGRIRVLDREDAKRPAYLEKEAAQALARLGPAAGWTALVEMATIFSGTIAGKDAALKAAQLAADRGDLGTAEAVLQRALALARPPERVAVAEAMVRLYEGMKWPRGVLRLRDDWSRLFAGAHPSELLDRTSTRAVQRTAALPPWRLRWQHRLPTNNMTTVITPAGLLYWTQDSKTVGCLALDTGLPRWQKDAATIARVQWGGQTSWEDSHIVSILVDGGVAFLDLWSGAVTTNAPLRIETANAYPVLGQIGIGTANAYPVFGRIGMAAVGSRAGGGVLTSADVLTGQVVWRRKEMELLQGAGVLPTPLAYASVGVFLMRCAPDGNAAFVTLDPWTGGVAFSRPVTANGSSLGLMASQGGMWSLAFPRTPEREVPVIADGRLSVRDRRTGVVLWTTPPDMVIAKSQTLLSGSVLVQTADEESVLFDGANGRIMCRSQGVRFACDYARQGEVGDAVIMSRRAEGGTNDIMVLDPAVNRIAFQGRLPQQMQPAMFLGPAAPNQLLVSENGYITGSDDQIIQSASIQVVNERGENINGWRLPRRADLGDGPRSLSRNIILAEGVIVIVDQTSGDVLAYEHDPGGMAKNP
jgi:outer membrane protein assembly factor BamB/tetratricopeptide (TPR) repeat protein